MVARGALVACRSLARRRSVACPSSAVRKLDVMSKSSDTMAVLDNLLRGRFHDRLVIVAQQLFDDAHDDAGDWCAVIAVSGLACDAAGAYALRCFLELDDQRPASQLNAGNTRKIRALLRSKKTINLKPKTQRQFWEALCGDRLARWPDWIRYLRSVERRNSILHEGMLPSRRPPSRADAIEALEVTRSLHAHLANVMRSEPLLRQLA